MRNVSSTPNRRAKRLRVLVGVAVSALAAVALAIPAAASAAEPAATPDAAQPVGCGYGTGGPYADTLCWIDMASYSDATARSAAGQPFSITLPGGYTTTFTAHTSGTNPVRASGFPTWGGAAIGNQIYLGTPGQPALYQDAVFGPYGVSTITLDDIAVTDSSGAAVQGWQFVGADAESTFGNESITFTSGSGVKVLATYESSPGQNGCQRNIVQVDPNTITCTGDLTSSGYGTALVSSTQPSSFTQTMTVGYTPDAREGVAFAFQSSKLQADATVVNRAAAGDTFDVSVTSPESTVVGTASTGDGSSASTGQLTVLPRVTDGTAYTLALTGTNLAAYTPTWTCDVNGVADTALSATGVTSLSVSPAAGGLVACRVSLDVAAVVPPTTPTPTPTPTTTAVAGPVTITPPTAAATAAKPALASTGLDASAIALGAAVLLALGAGAFAIRRRVAGSK
ncbi:hypothetical protein [Subtercola endophyticus]|uniref:hypothetical protein n=1 Tax=Subtercola endophyticus TaxID=2895559 RepID=UPI001E56F0AE|nr:hypothetical protein [Subtercola endophyticus]UFS60561.1 hypothetical protein LQ955_07420 [Subtercola endophyticus]